MTEYPKCQRCGETLYQGHICAGWPDRFTASTPPSSAPETRTSTHSHRCMRCQKEFPCVAPLRCEAGPVVLPRIVYLDIFGRIQMRDHCRNVLYKGFVGLATFDTEAKVYHGEVEGIRDVVTFEADDEDGVEPAFQASVDDYLEMLDVPIGKHGAYGTHTNGDGSPVLIPPASHSPGTPAPAETRDPSRIIAELEAELEFAHTFAPPNAFGARTMEALLDACKDAQRRLEAISAAPSGIAADPDATEPARLSDNDAMLLVEIADAYRIASHWDAGAKAKRQLLLRLAIGEIAPSPEKTHG